MLQFAPPFTPTKANKFGHIADFLAPGTKRKYFHNNVDFLNFIFAQEFWPWMKNRHGH